MPKILDPPGVDRPEYPSVDYVARAQAEDPLLSCVVLYLSTPLHKRNGQEMIEEELNAERQGMDDELLFRQRQDGRGLGMEEHTRERALQRERVREEYLLQLFHRHGLSLPIRLKEMLRVCRPLSLDPVRSCLYLCRRPDVPQALSQNHERGVYLMGGSNSPDDLLRKKKLVVPRASRNSVLWWSYQESQQRKHDEEQVGFSNS
jgi:hypothetical protein